MYSYYRCPIQERPKNSLPWLCRYLEMQLQEVSINGVLIKVRDCNTQEEKKQQNKAHTLKQWSGPKQKNKPNEQSKLITNSRSHITGQSGRSEARSRGAEGGRPLDLRKNAEETNIKTGKEQPKTRLIMRLTRQGLEGSGELRRHTWKVKQVCMNNFKHE